MTNSPSTSIPPSISVPPSISARVSPAMRFCTKTPAPAESRPALRRRPNGHRRRERQGVDAHVGLGADRDARTAYRGIANAGFGVERTCVEGRDVAGMADIVEGKGHAQCKGRRRTGEPAGNRDRRRGDFCVDIGRVACRNGDAAGCPHVAVEDGRVDSAEDGVEGDDASRADRKAAAGADRRRYGRRSSSSVDLAGLACGDGDAARVEIRYVVDCRADIRVNGIAGDNQPDGDGLAIRLAAIGVVDGNGWRDDLRVDVAMVDRRDRDGAVRVDVRGIRDRSFENNVYTVQRHRHADAHRAGAAATQGLGVIVDFRMDILRGVGRDRQVACDIDLRVGDRRLDRGAAVSLDHVDEIGADQRVDGVEQEVLPLHADGVEGEHDARRRLLGDGLRVHLGGDLRSAVGRDREVDAGDVAAGNGGVGIAQHVVGRDDAIDGDGLALAAAGDFHAGADIGVDDAALARRDGDVSGRVDIGFVDLRGCAAVDVVADHQPAKARGVAAGKARNQVLVDEVDDVVDDVFLPQTVIGEICGAQVHLGAVGPLILPQFTRGSGPTGDVHEDEVAVLHFLETRLGGEIVVSERRLGQIGARCSRHSRS